MVALSIAITVLLANIYLFNTAQKNLALARSLTDATNLATSGIADLRTRVISAPMCFDATTNVPNDKLENFSFTGNGSPCTRAGIAGDINPDYPGLVNEDFCSPPSSRNPNYPGKAADGPSAVPLCTGPGVRNPLFVPGARKVVPIMETGTTSVDGILFTSTWVLTDVDLQHDGSPDMRDNVMKITIDVTWRLEDRDHSVKMTTFTTGKAP
jgi:hypothetical protein